MSVELELRVAIDRGVDQFKVRAEQQRVAVAPAAPAPRGWRACRRRRCGCRPARARPSRSPSLSAMKRAGMSVGPPAAKPTTRRTAWSGYLLLSCGRGGSGKSRPSPIRAAASERREMADIMSRSLASLGRCACCCSVPAPSAGGDHTWHSGPRSVRPTKPWWPAARPRPGFRTWPRRFPARSPADRWPTASRRSRSRSWP